MIISGLVIEKARSHNLLVNILCLLYLVLLNIRVLIAVTFHVRPSSRPTAKHHLKCNVPKLAVCAAYLVAILLAVPQLFIFDSVAGYWNETDPDGQIHT